MKNKSPRYPFETPMDKHFDSNGDGKLDTFESMWRDSALDEMHRESQRRNTTSSSGTDSTAGCAMWVIMAVFFVVISLLFSSCGQ